MHLLIDIYILYTVHQSTMRGLEMLSCGDESDMWLARLAVPADLTLRRLEKPASCCLTLHFSLRHVCPFMQCYQRPTRWEVEDRSGCCKALLHNWILQQQIILAFASILEIAAHLQRGWHGGAGWIQWLPLPFFYCGLKQNHNRILLLQGEICFYSIYF